SVAVTVNGQTRTFKDGEGVTFPRNQGGKQTVTAKLEFVGYGITYSPLNLDDYAGRSMNGRIAVFLGRRGPGMGANEDRLVNASVRITIDADYDIIQTRLSRNVVGIVEGTDARLRDTYVLLGAHYDHVGYQQFAGTVAAGENAIAACAGQHRPETRPGDIINN